jgi:hypothetical protein
MTHELPITSLVLRWHSQTTTTKVNDQVIVCSIQTPLYIFNEVKQDVEKVPMLITELSHDDKVPMTRTTYLAITTLINFSSNSSATTSVLLL